LHFYSLGLFGEISKRLGVKAHLARYILPNEMQDYLLKNKRPDLAQLESNFHNLVNIIKPNGEVVTMKGRDAKATIDCFLQARNKNNVNPDFIKGTGASKGFVQARVKVILNAHDCDKLKHGEILVAPMTSPDYVIAMRKSVGIITDEGGMTCHAAIVSRELGIPCIVGTKIATQVLKDGDLVEVDANKGIVKKI